MYSNDQDWVRGYECLPVTVDGRGHGNQEIQGSTVSADPTTKIPINSVK